MTVDNQHATSGQPSSSQNSYLLAAWYWRHLLNYAVRGHQRHNRSDGVVVESGVKRFDHRQHLWFDEIVRGFGVHAIAPTAMVMHAISAASPRGVPVSRRRRLPVRLGFTECQNAFLQGRRDGRVRRNKA